MTLCHRISCIAVDSPKPQDPPGKGVSGGLGLQAEVSEHRKPDSAKTNCCP